MLATHSKGWTCTAWLPPSCMLSCSQSPMALKKLIKMWLAIIHIKLSIFEVLVLFSKIRLRLLKLSLPLQVLLIIEIFNILVLFALLACGPLASFIMDRPWSGWAFPINVAFYWTFFLKITLLIGILLISIQSGLFFGCWWFLVWWLIFIICEILRCFMWLIHSLLCATIFHLFFEFFKLFLILFKLRLFFLSRCLHIYFHIFT